MSTIEVGKWTEIWLDRAGERAYQPAFISALIHAGYTVLHNTSHNSLELGKDVICVSPSGQLVAFQLKGNPGTRLTMSQWHSIQPQILQLISSPIGSIFLGRSEPHTPILVTNGEIEEDVQAAIRLLNSDFVPTQSNFRPLEIWTRGKLISLFASVAQSAWPESIEGKVQVLRSASGTGKETVSEGGLQELAQECFSTNNSRLSTARSIERISAFVTLVNIMLSMHIQIGNLYEVIKAKAICAGLVAGFMDRNRLVSKKHADLFGLIRREILSLVSVFSELIVQEYAHRPMVNGDAVSEFGVIHARRMLVLGVISIHCLECERTGNTVSAEIREFVGRDITHPFLIGEFVVPSFLSLFWRNQR